MLGFVWCIFFLSYSVNILVCDVNKWCHFLSVSNNYDFSISWLFFISTSPTTFPAFPGLQLATVILNVIYSTGTLLPRTFFWPAPVFNPNKSFLIKTMKVLWKLVIDSQSCSTSINLRVRDDACFSFLEETRMGIGTTTEGDVNTRNGIRMAPSMGTRIGYLWSPCPSVTTNVRCWVIGSLLWWRAEMSCVENDGEETATSALWYGCFTHISFFDADDYLTYLLTRRPT